MALQLTPGHPQSFLGHNIMLTPGGITSGVGITLDATGEAAICMGRIRIYGGGTKTLDTSGPSAIGLRLNAVTFANGGTVASIGLAAVDAATGNPSRAVNVADIITADVAAVLTGGGLVTGWNEVVPTTGTKTLTDGDQLAIYIQLTTRAGADTMLLHSRVVAAALNNPMVTSFLGGAYTAESKIPNFVITCSDGTKAWLYGSDIFSTLPILTWNSSSTPAEYAQLFKIPYPAGIIGFHGFIDSDGDYDWVTYSDPLGTPVAQQTLAIDKDWDQSASVRQIFHYLPVTSWYPVAANQVFAIGVKPGASSISAYTKSLANADHRVVDVGLDSYMVSRASGGGAFTDFNAGKDHIAIGPILGSYDDAVAAGGRAGMLVSSGALVG